MTMRLSQMLKVITDYSANTLFHIRGGTASVHTVSNTQLVYMCVHCTEQRGGRIGVLFLSVSSVVAKKLCPSFPSTQ